MTHFETLSKLFSKLYGRDFGPNVMKFITHGARSAIINNCTVTVWNNFIIVQNYLNLCFSGMTDVSQIDQLLIEKMRAHCVDLGVDTIIDDFKNSPIKKYIDDMLIMIGDNKLALTLLRKLALFDFYRYLAIYNITYNSNSNSNSNSKLYLARANYFESLSGKKLGAEFTLYIVDQQFICYTNIIEIMTNVADLKKELHLIDEIAKSLSIQTSLLLRPF